MLMGRARTVHKCSKCGRTICVGQPYWSVDMGRRPIGNERYREATCIPCAKTYMKEIPIPASGPKKSYWGRVMEIISMNEMWRAGGLFDRGIDPNSAKVLEVITSEGQDLKQISRLCGFERRTTERKLNILKKENLVTEEAGKYRLGEVDSLMGKSG